MAFDRNRVIELDNMVRKMGGIISVFEVRSDGVGNPRFGAFRIMMDIFHSMCQRSLDQQKDFIDETVDMTEEEIEAVKAAFEKIFGKPPSSL